MKSGPARLDRVLEGLLSGKTQKENAEECGVSVRTVRRDIKKLQDSERFMEWLYTEFYKLHRRQDPKTAYQVVAQLLGKTLTQKIKAQAEISGEVEPKKIIIKMWNDRAVHPRDREEEPLKEGVDVEKVTINSKQALKSLEEKPLKNRIDRRY